jgi:hypothetical protein
LGWMDAADSATNTHRQRGLSWNSSGGLMACQALEASG